METKGNTQSSSASLRWIKQRLAALAIDRQANPADLGDTIPYYASCLSGFSQEAIEYACTVLGETRVGEYETRWPERGKLADLCREYENRSRVKKQKYCGLCLDGRRRVGGEVVICDCTCQVCGGSGVLLEQPNGKPWDSRTDWKIDRVARKCECRRKP